MKKNLIDWGFIDDTNETRETYENLIGEPEE